MKAALLPAFLGNVQHLHRLHTCSEEPMVRPGGVVLGSLPMHVPQMLTRSLLCVPFRLPDPASDTGGNCKQNWGPTSRNSCWQRQPVRGTRLACIWGGGGRTKRSREYLGLGSAARTHTTITPCCCFCFDTL